MNWKPNMRPANASIIGPLLIPSVVIRPTEMDNDNLFPDYLEQNAITASGDDLTHRLRKCVRFGSKGTTFRKGSQ